MVAPPLTGMNLLHAVDATGVKEDTLAERGLTRVDMGGNADISNSADLFHNSLKPLFKNDTLFCPVACRFDLKRPHTSDSSMVISRDSLLLSGFNRQAAGANPRSLYARNHHSITAMYANAREMCFSGQKITES